MHLAIKKITYLAFLHFFFFVWGCTVINILVVKGQQALLCFYVCFIVFLKKYVLAILLFVMWCEWMTVRVCVLIPLWHSCLEHTVALWLHLLVHRKSVTERKMTRSGFLNVLFQLPTKYWHFYRVFLNFFGNITNYNSFKNFSVFILNSRSVKRAKIYFSNR